ncbi:23S rRNA (adenine(2503)-C(2))-methyltransferase RlmN [Anaerosoma tenue]|uniref:23S rRNA (adenine(2503)-C(2))-methyltransferase RlmN n=1 Tax=Anaerosoma tenue TaxID=2933588 RepID=UPI002260B114|nr:23S rRNA (adenine(2503)-C(2))-methyltransferase RlmN [Anaerosoma tenue]MCK8115169.1 23S rRNA (adenine(2503)-C(2))-methyltransferase RlmN [Anaerosoma tenue]
MGEPTMRNVASLDAAGIETLIADLGEPGYRARQLTSWLYGRTAPSFDAMTDLPARLRARLADEWTLTLPSATDIRHSSDGTRKYLWQLADGVLVESVGIPSDGRLTVCFSTQAGCVMGCTFCATGRGGFVRNLLPGEIVWQVALVGSDFGHRVTNAVAMGQGEPFNNYEATLGALRLMNLPDGLGIGARHLTVSTCGVVPGIDRFAREQEQFTLAVSLHSAVQETRDGIMPGARRWPLPRLRQALIHYGDSTGRRPTLEFAVIAGRNDSPQEISALIAFARGWMCHINLIPVNPVEGSGAERPDPARVAEIAGLLQAAGIETSVRIERGTDIEAACGQLTQKHRAQDD